jgi:phage-related protein
MKFEVVFYKKNGSPIEDFILSQREELRLDIFAALKKMEDNPFALRTLSKKIVAVDNLFELRITGRNAIVRLLYCYRKNKIIVILHGFVKQSQKIPRRELQIAIERKKEIENDRP